MIRIKVRRGPPPLKEVEEEPQVHNGVGEVSVSVAGDWFAPIAQVTPEEQSGPLYRDPLTYVAPETLRRGSSLGLRIDAEYDEDVSSIRLSMYVPGLGTRQVCVTREFLRDAGSGVDYLVHRFSAMLLDSLRDDLEAEIRAAMVRGGIHRV